MTCREFGPDEAKEAGFLNRVVDDDQLDAAVDELVATSRADAEAGPAVDEGPHQRRDRGDGVHRPQLVRRRRAARRVARSGRSRVGAPLSRAGAVEAILRRQGVLRRSSGPADARRRRWCDEHLARAVGQGGVDVLDAAPVRRHHEQRAAIGAAEHAGEPARSSVIRSRISPPSRTRTHSPSGLLSRPVCVRVSAEWVHTAPSASRQMPSGPMPSAQTRRFDRLPSAAMSKAVRRPANDSETISVGVVGRDHHAVRELDAVDHLPRRAVGRHEGDHPRLRPAGTEGEADAVDVDVAPAVDDDLVPAEVDRAPRSACRTIAPSGSRRSSSSPVTRRRPSGSQSIDQPRPAGPAPTTSLLPSRSTATISPVPQWANQRRSSCQRGDST